MVWTTPRDAVVGEQYTAAILNTDFRDNLLAIDDHGHTGASGKGSQTLGDLVKATHTDAAAPTAPASGLTSIYTVSGRLKSRTNGGASIDLVDAATLHDEDHASRHEPSGADTMEVDAVTGTGSLRTLGTGARQGAIGSHAAHL